MATNHAWRLPVFRSMHFVEDLRASTKLDALIVFSRVRAASDAKQSLALCG
jgi:hypothetical protein